MYDRHLVESANALARAIGNRWGGWYAVGVGRDGDGRGSIRVAYDQDHLPALSLHAEYNGYPVHLRPAVPPETAAATG
jgi:hypothetical protein